MSSKGFRSRCPRTPAAAIIGTGVVAVIIAGTQSAVAQSAGVGLGITPLFPPSVEVGQTGVAAQLSILNNSTGVGPVTVGQITLNPNCADVAPSCAIPDPGVFSLSTSGIGSAGACNLTSFTIGPPDANGRSVFTPGSPVVLTTGGGANSTCTINFTFTVVKLPTKDADPSPGLQTRQFATIDGTAQTIGAPPSTLAGGGTGTSITTVSALSPPPAAVPGPGPARPTPTPATPNSVTGSPTPQPSARGIAGPPDTGGAAAGRQAPVAAWVTAFLGSVVLAMAALRTVRRRGQ